MNLMLNVLYLLSIRLIRRIFLRFVIIYRQSTNLIGATVAKVYKSFAQLVERGTEAVRFRIPKRIKSMYRDLYARNGNIA